MIGIPQLSPTPQGDVMVDVPGWLHTVSAIPAELMQPGTEVSHKLWVMPHRGLLSLPTHTSQPSSFIWNGLFAPPQSVLNGAGSSLQLVRNLRP